MSIVDISERDGTEVTGSSGVLSVIVATFVMMSFPIELIDGTDILAVVGFEVKNSYVTINFS
jgi:hypothetical protein